MSNEIMPAKPESKGPTPSAPDNAKRELLPKPVQYVGPNYKYGITLPGQSERIDPKNMTEDERKALIDQYPEAASWWA